MRTTVAGALLLFGGFIVGKVASAGGVHAEGFYQLIGLLMTVGIGCLMVGPILWVRGARREKAEQMALLRQIAAQGQQPPTG